MTGPASTGVTDALTDAARQEGGRLVALLAHRFGRVDLADDAVQDALAEAWRTWPASGVPRNPVAWLHISARRNMLDRLRSEDRTRRRLQRVAHERLADNGDGDDSEQVAAMVDTQGEVGDERLRLLLLCCHPSLERETQVALTLRLVGGLTTPEIAAAFLVPEATLAQRIVRAKRKIRDAGIPLSIPDPIDLRRDAILEVLYLIFNEGYLSHGPSAAVRVDLVDEAIRLTDVLNRLLVGQAEIEGLLALELFAKARIETRTDAFGDLVLLEDQDRRRWNLETIRHANALLAQAMSRLSPGPYQVQAIIAAHHANAPTAADTDWSTIAALYAQLTAMTSSPVVGLNHAVAIAMADGPQAGLAALARLDLAALDRYHLFHATKGELLLRNGQPREAFDAFTNALAQATNDAERSHLRRRIELAAHE